MAAEALLSIGVYGFSEEEFFAALNRAQADCFCDVRARRGLRGREYAFANSKRLQDRLRRLEIDYVHVKTLAPSLSVRNAQRLQDEELGVGKRSRSELGPAFRAAYTTENLQSLNAGHLLDNQLSGARRPVFFCVEREPRACHRSLLVDELAAQTGLPVEHILP